MKPAPRPGGPHVAGRQPGLPARRRADRARLAGLFAELPKGLDQDEQEKDTGHYIRRERYAGACERSFYVGENMVEEDIKGEFKHGILKLFIPKKEEKPAIESRRNIL